MHTSRVCTWTSAYPNLALVPSSFAAAIVTATATACSVNTRPSAPQMFVFQFVNSYSCLLYVGFWLRDLKRLRQLLMTMMMIKQFVGQLVEKYQPVVMLWWKNRNLKKNVRNERQGSCRTSYTAVLMYATFVHGGV